jgi:hypothetical protein
MQLAQDRGRWQLLEKYGDEPVGSGATELVMSPTTVRNNDLRSISINPFLLSRYC